MNSCTHALSILITALAMWITPAIAQPGQTPVDQSDCPPDCMIAIEVPEDQGQAPIASPVTLMVKPGQEIEFRSTRGTQVIFPE
jgi:hypothetical protein